MTNNPIDITIGSIKLIGTTFERTRVMKTTIAKRIRMNMVRRMPINEVFATTKHFKNLNLEQLKETLRLEMETYPI